MKKTLLCFLVIWALVGCSTPEHKNFFIKEEKIDEANFEYIGDIIVNKEGYHFLWFIPFASGKKESAIRLMKEKAVWGFPGAAGIFELRETGREEVALFDWTPLVKIEGKVVKRKE
ncbi:MAG: hypothetical protein HUU50_02905 [Candidatus Brocadiae bacterium]|nr:hypothetical protein [Candidatus Brocadiia bacterium]